MVNWIATPHLFPVLYTSSTQGLCNFISRLVAILAPLVAEVVVQPYPMVIVSVMGGIAAFMAFFLKPIVK